jgi:hypothetical protein
MARFLIVLLVAWLAPTGATWAQSQKAAVCGGSCGGGCGPCAGDSNQAGNSAPAQPSAWLRNREQILEGRGVKAYDRCVADFSSADFDGAITACQRSIDAYVDAFGSPTSARGREASQALAAAENARAAALFHRGKCDEAAALFQSAASHDPATSAYGRNATLFTASACAAASGSSRRVSDLAAAPPPPPPTTFASTAPVRVISDDKVISPANWQAARDAFHQLSPFVSDYAIAMAGRRVPGGTEIAEMATRVTESAEMRTKYNQLAHDLVDEATGAMTETVSILGGGDGTKEHVLDTPERMARMVNQYVSDQIADILSKQTRKWLIGHFAP